MGFLWQKLIETTNFNCKTGFVEWDLRISIETIISIKGNYHGCSWMILVILTISTIQIQMNAFQDMERH